MKLIQLNDGSCDILFNQQELDILNKVKKINLPPEAFKHTINQMMAVLIKCADNLPEEAKNLMSETDQEIEVKNIEYKKEGFEKL
jgi:hypothetical protein